MRMPDKKLSCRGFLAGRFDVAVLYGFIVIIFSSFGHHAVRGHYFSIPLATTPFVAVTFSSQEKRHGIKRIENWYRVIYFLSKSEI